MIWLTLHQGGLLVMCKGVTCVHNNESGTDDSWRCTEKHVCHARGQRVQERLRVGVPCIPIGALGRSDLRLCLRKTLDRDLAHVVVAHRVQPVHGTVEGITRSISALISENAEV
jgi:hypothetical protein